MNSFQLTLSHKGNKIENRRIESPQSLFRSRYCSWSRSATGDGSPRVESHGGDGSPACTAAVVSHLMQARGDVFFLRSAYSRSPVTRTRPSGSGGSDLSSVRRLPVSPVSAAFRVCVHCGAEPSRSPRSFSLIAKPLSRYRPRKTRTRIKHDPAHKKEAHRTIRNRRYSMYNELILTLYFMYIFYYLLIIILYSFMFIIYLFYFNYI